GQYRPRVQVGLETHQCIHKEVETRDAHIIFHAESVPSLWRMCSYNWDCRWMGLYSPDPLNLLIGEPYATIFWVQFRIIFTEVGSRKNTGCSGTYP
ncbi:hypothetical protein Gotur_025227, partial [Gossypium turneri]